MAISELGVYDFLKDKIKLSETEARACVREMVFAEEQLRNDVNVTLKGEMQRGNYLSKKIEEIQTTQPDNRIEKGFRELIIVIIGLMAAFAGFAVAIAKLCL